MINSLLLSILFFGQLQWLSVIAGILFSYFQNIKDAPKRHWLMPFLAITLLLLVQTFGNVLLISLMYCGHLSNAILQGFGGITFFTIGAFSYHWLPRKPLLSHITLGGLLGGLILFGWQNILLYRYSSVEWWMLFFVPCGCLIVFVTILKIAFWYWGNSKNRMRRKQHQTLNLVYAGLWYMLFTTITSFFSAIAFDCGF